MDAGSYVKATPTSIFAAGKPCAANKWYLGTRTPMFTGATVQDTGDDTYVIQPFKSDFSVPSMDKMVFLSVVGASSERGSACFFRKSDSTDDRHRLSAVMSPRANYYQRLNYYGSSKYLSLYPMASTTDWNALT